MATKTKTKVQSKNGVMYQWRGGGCKVPAQVVGEELARLEVKPGDFHKTSDVLDEARHPDSPLHGCFEWDDTVAAEQHRLHQCRNMLRSIAYVIVRNEKRVKQPVYLHIRDEEGPRYVKADRVAQNKSLREAALDEVMAMLTGLRRRFEHIEELAPIFEAIGQVERKVNKRKK